MQIPAAPADVPKTAVCTPFGLFHFLFMPFGLKGAGSTFQRFMDSLFANSPNVFVYLDDILVASETEEQHLSDLEHVFSILATHNLRLSVDKCLFFQSSLLFLGYTISSGGVRPPEDHLSAITSLSLIHI